MILKTLIVNSNNKIIHFLFYNLLLLPLCRHLYNNNNISESENSIGIH